MRCFFFAAGCTVLALLAGLAGCGKSDQAYHEIPKGMKVHDDPHSHQLGPHYGHIVELGEEEYHAEVVLDPTTSKITIYILDSEAKKAAPVDAKEITLTLAIDGKPKPFAIPAAAEEGDPKGKASRFELPNNPDIKAHIKSDKDLKGTVGMTISEKPYTGLLAGDK